jgi:hypothetical protein
LGEHIALQKPAIAYGEGFGFNVTAVPEEGHFFVGWSGACVGREVTCKIPVSGAVGVGAGFQ